MSVNDPVFVFYDERRGKYRLLRGNETFYNERREMIEFDRWQDAEKWANDVLGENVGMAVSDDPIDDESPIPVGIESSGDGQYKFVF